MTAMGNKVVLQEKNHVLQLQAKGQKPVPLSQRPTQIFCYDMKYGEDLIRFRQGDKLLAYNSSTKEIVLKRRRLNEEEDIADMPHVPCDRSFLIYPADDKRLFYRGLNHIVNR